MTTAEDLGGTIDDSTNIVSQFSTYDEYLTSQITALDLSYLEDEDIARQLVELGYRGAGDILKREEFEAKKKAVILKRDSTRVRKKSLAGTGKLIVDPFLRALAEREEANKNGKLCTVVFIRDKNAKNQEISGYIDYAHRLKIDDFEQYFLQKKKLLPKSTDLSFYNWETHVVSSNPSSNYQVVFENVTTLYFRNRIDRKILDVDPRAPTPGDSSIRTVIRSPDYIQTVLYDHITRHRL